MISSLEVYGAEMFKTALVFPLVISMALSNASKTSDRIRLRCPNSRIDAPYRSNRSPCCASCVNFILAIFSSPSTSYFDRLKFSRLNA